MKKFMQIDRSVEVNGRTHHVRLQEKPGGRWDAFDMAHLVHASDIDMESSFEKWEQKARLLDN